MHQGSRATCSTSGHELTLCVKRYRIRNYRIFCEAFSVRQSSRTHSPADGKKISLRGEFLNDLYHPRALWSAAAFQSPLLGWRVARMQPVLSSAAGSACTTRDAWLYRDQSGGISGWPSVSLLGELEPARIRQPNVCTGRYRRLARDDCAQKTGCTAAISTGKVKNSAS